MVAARSGARVSDMGSLRVGRAFYNERPASAMRLSHCPHALCESPALRGHLFSATDDFLDGVAKLGAQEGVRGVVVAARMPQESNRHRRPLRRPAQRVQPERIAGNRLHAPRDQAEEVRAARNHEDLENLRHLHCVMELQPLPGPQTLHWIVTLDARPQTYERALLEHLK